MKSDVLKESEFFWLPFE